MWWDLVRPHPHSGVEHGSCCACRRHRARSEFRGVASLEVVRRWCGVMLTGCGRGAAESNRHVCCFARWPRAVSLRAAVRCAVGSRRHLSSVRCPKCRFLSSWFRAARPSRKPAGQSDCSPRPRGWTLADLHHVDRCLLLPAPAGMDPKARQRHRPGIPAPRARGDGPVLARLPVQDARCSPRPRGWTRPRRRRSTGRSLLPTPAGMDPTARSTAVGAHPAPRARGDGPDVAQGASGQMGCSPRPRGWTRALRQRGEHVTLLPAPAGMDPSPKRTAGGYLPAPRARGDGPCRLCTAPAWQCCSPRPRGWTHLPGPRPGRILLLPAPPGMDPSSTSSTHGCCTAPRACGNGPKTWSVSHTGWRDATLANLMKIADALHCPVVVLERKRAINADVRA